MLRFVKTFSCLALLALGLPAAYAFTPLGPQEAWQVAGIGYDRLNETAYPSGSWLSFSTPEWTYAPKNYNEWYRWNVPTLYYTYDPTFITYFGTEGIKAVDKAFDILNGVGNVDAYSRDLTEVPVDEFRQNYTATSLHLFDLKSAALEMMMPRLGLADPEAWTWCIRAKILIPGASCPFYDYNVIQRNFDPVTIAPSKFVNGNLFTYQFLIFCPPGGPDRQDPIEFLVDPVDTYRTAVATAKITMPRVEYLGYFHSGLTRDDVGGLRYLYTTNRVSTEIASPDALLFQTNFTPTLLVSSNLTLLAAQALTNDAPTLQALFPGLIILGTTSYFTNVWLTNLTAYFTNFPWDPIGTPAHIVFLTNVTPTVQTVFNHVFGNLLTVSNSPSGPVPVPLVTLPRATRGWVSVQTTSVAASNNPWAPAGSILILTNTSTVTYRTNEVVGEYFLLPTNLCSIQILFTQLTFTNALTNAIVTATNFPVISTNSAGGTNAGTVLSFSQNLISYFTNHAYVTYPVTCETNNIALRQGVEHLTFVRHDYDDLLSRFFFPITNNYSTLALISNVWVRQQFQRIVIRPDILINAADINDIPIVPTVDRSVAGAPVFSNAVPGSIVQGTIQGPVTITFNQVGPVHLNSGPFFVDEASAFLYYNWGSFDGSTNEPVVYGGTSVNELAQQLAITIQPLFLTNAVQGVNYFQELTVAGGQPPYTWSLAPGTVLPVGMSFAQNPADDTRASLFGPPLVRGREQFIIRVTDAAGRFADANYVLQIDAP